MNSWKAGSNLNWQEMNPQFRAERELHLSPFFHLDGLEIDFLNWSAFHPRYLWLFFFGSLLSTLLGGYRGAKSPDSTPRKMRSARLLLGRVVVAMLASPQWATVTKVSALRASLGFWAVMPTIPCVSRSWQTRPCCQPRQCRVVTFF